MNVIMHRQPRRAARALSHDAARYFEALGCASCKDREHCGGLSLPGGLLNCYAQCCGKPQACGWVCRNNSDFARHVRSIRGFDLGNVRPADIGTAPPLPDVVPLIYHGYRRQQKLAVPAAAIKLVQLFDRRDGAARFQDRGALMHQFMLSPETLLLASGVDDDPAIERWWAIGARARREVITSMRRCGIALVTCPNYSLCLDWPRTGDLAAMKRIALCYEEFAEAGQSAALHVNGRTDFDFHRWGKFLAKHPSITHVSYEFTTGAGRQSRRDMHIAWLAELPDRAGRPLDIVVYGDSAVARTLANHYRSVTWIETTSFIKAVHRQKAVRSGNDRLSWDNAPTPESAPIDDLVADNIAETAAWFRLHRSPD